MPATLVPDLGGLLAVKNLRELFAEQLVELVRRRDHVQFVDKVKPDPMETTL
ncbi:MAG: hypothetical protein WBS19_20505 [Candidatus Korobacteraceae bacterium]